MHVDYNKAASFWKALKTDILESGLGAVQLGDAGDEASNTADAAVLEISGYLNTGSGPQGWDSETLAISPKTAPATSAWFKKNYQVKFE